MNNEIYGEMKKLYETNQGWRTLEINDRDTIEFWDRYNMEKTNEQQVSKTKG